MFEGRQLTSAFGGRRGRESGKAVKLGQAVQRFFDERVSVQQARFGSVAEVWGRLLPSELAEHCEIADVSGGQLKVKVDSSSYLYELRLCSSELLGELQQQCPRARLTGIRLVVG